MEQLAKRLYNWASMLEEKTREQALQTAEMPFIFPHVALMPDAHLGLGATVESVIPTRGAIMPAAVGVDIGCGMIAVKSQFERGDAGSLDRSRLRTAIERAIPLSAGSYNKDVAESARGRVEELHGRDGANSAEQVAPNWPLQLGSLGSGNHFVEVTVDETDRIWLFLHSGSRGVGNKLAQRAIKTSQRLCEKWWIPLPNKDLAYLVQGTDEFWAYIGDLRWAQHFALLNREEMMDRLIACVSEWLGAHVEEKERINCHHNFTQQEKHFGEQVWVSRKGAIEASESKAGLIPGSMGTASYVVSGKGNRMSLNSSPHGAGRAHSRRAARALFTLDQLDAAMGDIEYRRTAAFLDEHPGAYKDIDQVMADAAELVEVRHTLRQIVNVKGD